MGASLHSENVTSFAELHQRLSRFAGTGWIFRGHANLEWPLVPKAGRDPRFTEHERALFEQWKRGAVESLGSQHGAPESDWLAIAQHHGLATRLLDWTINPLNAAFFAVRESGDGPAVIHAATFEPGFDQYAESLSIFSEPPEGGGVKILRPRGIVPRIVRQGGLFTVHDPPNKSLESFAEEGIVTLEKILIRDSYRRELRVELARYGINASSLFPDLDGLSDYLNWTVESGLER